VYKENKIFKMLWTADLEVNLFHALKGHKPTGINRFFHMACVHHKLISSCQAKDDLSSKHVWQHLNDMYNLETLNELDDLPFPNNNTDFSLPEEMTMPELMMSAPCSPATSIASIDENVSSSNMRPTNLNLTNIKNSNLLSTPDCLVSPKRKRNARQAQLVTNSQPSSPAATPGASASKRRR